MADRRKVKVLGRQTNTPGRIDAIDYKGVVGSVTLHCSEFTSRCPVTGQPDFGLVEITYEPADRIAETKSVKLYLQGFREVGKFNEEIVAQIADEFFEAVKPVAVTVRGRFGMRGGISVEATSTRGGVA